MQVLGVKNDVSRPIIRANGESMETFVVENTVGEIAKASFTVPPENFNAFKNYGELVEIDVRSESANGTLFKGVIVGHGFSNTVGSLNCRVDLVHEDGYELDMSSTLFPGHNPGSMLDNKAYVKSYRAGASNNTKGGGTIIPFFADGEFWNKGVAKACNDYISSAESHDSHSMEKPQDYSKVLEVIGGVRSYLGTITNAGIVEGGLAELFNSSMKGATSNTTFWNTLSYYLAQVDATLCCDPRGGLIVVPNFQGISATQEYDAGAVVTFDHSCKFDRTPKEIFVVVRDSMQGESTVLKSSTRKVGHYQSEALPSSHGSLTVNTPSWMRPITLVPENDPSRYDAVMNKYAELTYNRNMGKMMMSVLHSALTLDLVPGTPKKFKSMSNIKTFDGERLDVFDREYDGYCYSIRHSGSTSGYPKTSLYFSHVAPPEIKKPTTHPIWPSGSQPEW